MAIPLDSAVDSDASALLSTVSLFFSGIDLLMYVRMLLTRAVYLPGTSVANPIPLLLGFFSNRFRAS